jgi:hypothetical protein
MIARERCLRGERELLSVAERRRKKRRSGKKAQGDVRELMDQFSSW